MARFGATLHDATGADRRNAVSADWARRNRVRVRPAVRATTRRVRTSRPDDARRWLRRATTSGDTVSPFGRARWPVSRVFLAGRAVAETPEDLAVQLADALVESFALSDSVTTEVGADGRSVTFGVSGSAFGSVERFDHPISSFVAVGLARALDRPISVEQLAAGGEDTEYLVRCSWESDAPDEGNEENSERDE
ncbi:hypothetical protein [Haladaptatus sp. R4]|uniref:hypothetical protein n=1 Tax=Haladaptatus sp. R4 TaxID=1679489 RepID=UPI001CBD18C1|nr:hypothetical protein [Haladaptatus sp. R4]